MSTNKTEHLNLHQWEAADPFLREEFNENFAAIDQFAGAADHIVVGAYNGNNAATREIDLGFAPKAVLLLGEGDNNTRALLAWPGTDCVGQPNGEPAKVMLAVTEKGFRVAYATYIGGTNTYQYTPITNKSTWKYRYLAVK